MTDAPSKEAQFKQTFFSVLADLKDAGSRDGEAMALIGSLAADIARQTGQSSWTGAKAALSRQAYDELLASFQDKGNSLHQAGRTKQAYAIQALGVSLVAGTQRGDGDIAAGLPLLDSLIDRAAALVRAQAGRMQ